MLTSQMGIVAPNGGVHKVTAILRPKVTVAATFRMDCNLCGAVFGIGLAQRE